MKGFLNWLKAYFFITLNIEPFALNWSYERKDGIRHDYFKWNDEYPLDHPFYVPIYLEQDLPFTYKFIYDRKWFPGSGIAVRTDKYRYAWVKWWLMYRVMETLKVIDQCGGMILSIWGINKVYLGEMPSFKFYLIKKSWIGKTWKALFPCPVYIDELGNN